MARFDHLIWLRFFGELITHLALAMIVPFLAIYLDATLNTSAMVVGLIVGIAPLGNVLGSLVGGTLADRVGRRPVMIFALVVQGLSMAGFIYAQSAWQFAVTTLLQSLGGSFYHPAANAMVADVTPEEKRGQAYGLMRVGINFGFAVGPLIGASVFLISPAALFMTGTIVLVLFAMVLAIYLPETLSKAENQNQEPVSFGRRILDEGKDLGVVFQDRILAFYLVISVFVTMSFAQFDTILPLYLKELTGVETTFAYLLVINAGMVVLFQMLVAARTEKSRSGRVMALAALFFGLGLLAFARGGTMGWLAAAMVIFTVGELLDAPVRMKFVVSLAPDDMRGRYLGVERLSSLGAMAAPVLGGFLMDRYGGSAAIGFMAILALSTIPALLYLDQMIIKKGKHLGLVSPIGR